MDFAHPDIADRVIIVCQAKMLKRGLLRTGSAHLATMVLETTASKIDNEQVMATSISFHGLSIFALLILIELA